MRRGEKEEQQIVCSIDLWYLYQKGQIVDGSVVLLDTTPNQQKFFPFGIGARDNDFEVDGSFLHRAIMNKEVVVAFRGHLDLRGFQVLPPSTLITYPLLPPQPNPLPFRTRGLGVLGVLGVVCLVCLVCLVCCDWRACCAWCAWRSLFSRCFGCAWCAWCAGCSALDALGVLCVLGVGVLGVLGVL